MRTSFIAATTRNALLILTGLGLCAPVAARGGPHPRLLIKPDDLPRLRHACGVGVSPSDVQRRGRFGEQAAAFNALRSYFSQRLGDVVLPGELPAAAFLHLVSPDDPRDAARLAAINNTLTRPLIVATDTLETVLALDWCWEAVDPAARREFLLEMRREAQPLTPADSPLDHRVFREKLAALALALAVDEHDEPNPSWGVLRKRILTAAKPYFATTFPTYVAWRGLVPTGPGVAAVEENDTALAVELAGLLTGANQWGAYRDSVGRWMEHYVVAASAQPALQHQFLRDDGSAAPLTPAARWEALLPLTAHLIAARTHDPAAAYVAAGVAARLHDPANDPSATLWRWVPLVFDLRDVRPADINRLPRARNLDGAVVLGGGVGPNAAVIWIDAGQPFLRRGQHFDAGHFLIRAGGHLVVSGGDDIEFEATYSKGGLQRLGDGHRSFDFAQYFTATIAHNCMLFWDAVRVPRWYGRRYAPTGGQVPRESTCTDFVTPLEAGPRLTAKLLAYGHAQEVAYVALDLTSAYDRRSVKQYTREFVYLWDRVLVVIDRAETANLRIIPTWVINLPARPGVDGKDLDPAVQTAGTDNHAGVWRYDDAGWVHWTDRDGTLWLGSVLPKPRSLAIVGGPARKQIITEGPHEGRTYVGGDPDGFEHLILPSGRPNPANAWYRLGKPMLLGPQFGVRPHWGRVEIEPTGREERYVFVNTLVIGTGRASTSPNVSLVESDDQVTVLISLATERARLVLPKSGPPGGELQVQTPESLRWSFPSSIVPDEALPVR